MEDKIEVNEYVRTKDGRIAQIKSIDYEAGIYRFDRIIYINDFRMKEDVLYNNEMFKKLIVKHSKQLINLVEVKDVIRYRIDNISTTLETKGYVEGIVDISDEEMLQKIKSDKNYHIFEILTRQQFEANCYETREENNNVHRYI